MKRHEPSKLRKHSSYTLHSLGIDFLWRIASFIRSDVILVRVDAHSCRLCRSKLQGACQQEMHNGKGWCKANATYKIHVQKQSNENLYPQAQVMERANVRVEIIMVVQLRVIQKHPHIGLSEPMCGTCWSTQMRANCWWHVAPHAKMQDLYAPRQSILG